MAKQNQKFKLEQNFLEKLIQPLKNKNKDISFVIEKSKLSNSLYLYLNYENTILALRLANHPTNLKWHKNQLIITEQTNCGKITKEIKSFIERIRKKRIQYLFNKLKENGNGK